MTVYYEDSNNKNIINYLVFVGDVVFAMSKNKYGDDNVVTKVGDLSNDGSFIIMDNRIVPIQFATKTMIKMDEKDIPVLIRKRFGLWTY